MVLELHRKILMRGNVKRNQQAVTAGLNPGNQEFKHDGHKISTHEHLNFTLPQLSTGCHRPVWQSFHQ